MKITQTPGRKLDKHKSPIPQTIKKDKHYSDLPKGSIARNAVKQAMFNAGLPDPDKSAAKAQTKKVREALKPINEAFAARKKSKTKIK